MERMFAPWRQAFVSGQERSGPPVPGGCIFCAFPLPLGDAPPATVVVEQEEIATGCATRGQWDAERLVVTNREHAFVILNKYPYTNGHVMVVPHAHTDQLESLSEETFLGVHKLLRETIAAVRETYRPDGINVGMNMGRAAGAGIDAHVHYHVLPRWLGDNNFMPVLADTRVISEGIDDTYARLIKLLRRPEDDVA